MGAVAKSYSEEMRKHLVIYEEVVCHLWLCKRSLLDFLTYEKNFVSFFISVLYLNLRLDNCTKSEKHILVDIAPFPIILAMFNRVKGTLSRDFRLLVFFMDQFPPSIGVYHYGHFEFFRKIAEIFAAQGTPLVSTTPVANRKNLQAEKF
jgi:hypothetical protein